MTDTPDDATPATDAHPSPDPTEPTAPEGFSTGDVRLIPLDRIDLDDTRFRFRATLRVGTLSKSIKADGLHVPIIVRSFGRGRGTRYQIISGFRRTTAVRDLGFEAVPAVVRNDLEDDEEAFRASVLENTQRKTWSDIDRALVIRGYDERGHTGREIAEVLGLTDRQARNIRSLLELPEEAQRAVDDEGDKVTATHAITVRQLAARYPDLDWGRWGEWSQMTRPCEQEHSELYGTTKDAGGHLEDDALRHVGEAPTRLTRMVVSCQATPTTPLFDSSLSTCSAIDVSTPSASTSGRTQRYWWAQTTVGRPPYCRR
jgi:ParB/RepB/Spo0J family partition protein